MAATVARGYSRCQALLPNHASEDQLQRILNLAVANVAGCVGNTEEGVALRALSAINDAVLDCATASAKSGGKRIGIRALNESYVGVPEHGVVRQIEELHAELNSRLLAEEAIAVERSPVLED